MELHMVFFNKDYDTSDQAQGYKDGLVVLASFFEVRDRDREPTEESSSNLYNVFSGFYQYLDGIFGVSEKSIRYTYSIVSLLVWFFTFLTQYTKLQYTIFLIRKNDEIG